jgi:hypothetical protein
MSKEIKALLERDSTFRQSDEGYLEEYDINTGELLKVHGTPKEATLASDLYHEINLSNGKTILVSPSVNPTHYVNNSEIQFSWMMVDLICQRLREGDSLTRICKEDGYPSYDLLCKWRRVHKDIDMMLEQAREDRGEYLADEAMELRSLEPNNKTEADDKKTNFDILKWGAEKGNSSRYGNKTKIDVTARVATMLVIETGIRKDTPDANRVVDETQRIRDAEKIVIPEGGGADE